MIDLSSYIISIGVIDDIANDVPSISTISIVDDIDNNAPFFLSVSLLSYGSGGVIYTPGSGINIDNDVISIDSDTMKKINKSYSQGNGIVINNNVISVDDKYLNKINELYNAAHFVIPSLTFKLIYGSSGLDIPASCETGTIFPSASLKIQCSDPSNAKVSLKIDGTEYNSNDSYSKGDISSSKSYTAILYYKDASGNSKSITQTAKVTYYDYMFFGTSVSEIIINSTNIRNLGNSKALANSFDIKLPAGHKHIYIAIPASKTLSSCKNKVTTDDVTSNFTFSTCSVVNGSGTVHYASAHKVYKLSQVNAFSSDVIYSITLK